MEREMHTLCLLDIKVKEQSVENMMKGEKDGLSMLGCKIRVES